jgi:copper chaperone CopZ
MKKIMIHLIFALSLGYILPSYAAQIIKVDVGGMMCEYCIEEVKKSLKKLSAVRKADVYYKDEKRGDGAYLHLKGDMNNEIKSQLEEAVRSKGFFIKKISIVN